MSIEEVPSKWSPASVSDETISTLRKIIGLAVTQQLVDRSEAEKALKILAINPHARLTRLGKHLTQIEKHFANVRSVAINEEMLVADTREELAELRAIIEANAEWESSEYDEPAA